MVVLKSNKPFKRDGLKKMTVNTNKSIEIILAVEIHDSEAKTNFSKC